MRKAFFATTLVALTSGGAACAGPPATDPVASNLGPSFAEFMAAEVEPDPATPGRFIVERDIAITGEDRVYEYYLRHYAGGDALTLEQNATPSGHVDSVLTSPMNITYCLDSAFTASEKTKLLAALDAASASWEAAAKVNFIYVPSQDGPNCTHDGLTNFGITIIGGTTTATASSPFPSERARGDRFMTLFRDSTAGYFPDNLAPVMRHELGHVLGFMHEHIRSENTHRAACPGDPADQSLYRAVTSYDSASIMHYPESRAPGCGGTGDFVELSYLDKYGAQLVYGDPFKVVPADYDGDGRTDMAKYQQGAWFIDYSHDGYGSWNLVVSGYGDAQPVPGRYDGDALADIAIYNPTTGAWLVDYARDGFAGWNATYTGRTGTGAIAVPADYDGDGRLDLAIKTTTGLWKIEYSAVPAGSPIETPSSFVSNTAVWDVLASGVGDAASIPVPADYDGDALHRADISVKDNATGIWHIAYAPSFTIWATNLSGFGGGNAVPVPADYNGDGIADLSVKTTTGTWYIDTSPSFTGWNESYTGYGDQYSRPVPGFYDGDAKADLAVKSATDTWFIDFAANTYGGWNLIVPLATAPQAP